MTDKKWLEACDGLIAQFTGCDSGIKDDHLTDEVVAHWESLNGAGKKKLILKLAKSLLAEDSPYGPEDLQEYLNWIYNEVFA